MGKLQNDASTNHSENEGNDKSNEIENYKSMDTETHIKDPRSKVRMSSITSATSTISLGNKSEKSEDKNKKYHKKDKQKSQPHSVINQSIPQKAPIKPPVTLATNKQQPSSLPQVANANQGAYVNDRTIYIEGLPFGSNESEVRTFFGECGQIVSVRLPTWHDTGRLKGYGHIEFASSESVTQAFNLDGMC